jgi:acylphosphatase
LARIQGRVQGVGFRYTCFNEARRLGLRGWVRNTPAAAVEVWAEGGLEHLDCFLQWLRRGPPRARVDQLDITRHPPSREYQDFTIEG